MMPLAFLTCEIRLILDSKRSPHWETRPTVAPKANICQKYAVIDSNTQKDAENMMAPIKPPIAPYHVLLGLMFFAMACRPKVFPIINALVSVEKVHNIAKASHMPPCRPGRDRS